MNQSESLTGWWVATVALLALLCTSSTVCAQSAFGVFEQSGRECLSASSLASRPETNLAQRPCGYAFELDGKELDYARIYVSDRASAFLVLARDLGLILIDLNAETVGTVNSDNAELREDGTVQIRSDDRIEPLGSLQRKPEGVTFVLNGKTAQLKMTNREFDLEEQNRRIREENLRIEEENRQVEALEEQRRLLEEELKALPGGGGGG